jgi:predicted Zn-dependent peptidase
MAISMENNEGYMLGAGKSFLVHNEIDTMEEVYKKVMGVTADQIAEVAEEIFSKTSTLIYQ